MTESNPGNIASPVVSEVAAKQRFRTRIHPELLLGGMIAGTFFSSLVIVLAGYMFGFFAIAQSDADLSIGTEVSLPIAFTYTSLFFLIGKNLTILEDSFLKMRRSALAWILSFMVLGCTAFLLKESSVYSRAAVLSCFLIGLFALPVFQLCVSLIMTRLVEKGRIWFEQIALVGLSDIEELQKIEEELTRRGILVAQKSLISLAQTSRSRYLSRCREITVEIQSTLSQLRLDGVWIVAQLTEQRRIDELRAALAQIPLPVVLFPNKAIQKTLHSKQIEAGSYCGYEVQRAPLTRAERGLKRTMDIAIASSALAVLSLVFALAALAIWIESGSPIFFRQDRKGFGGRPFKILKFRSMYVLENGPDIKQAEKSDPRITPLGRILRRTSVDELPQFINVLKGEMSIVGPRPHAIAHDNFYDRIIATYAFRHHAKPGITGWAQVNGFRGNTSELFLMEGRIEHDIWYINHWSPWLDLKIMTKTALEVLWHSGAH